MLSIFGSPCLWSPTGRNPELNHARNAIGTSCIGHAGDELVTFERKEWAGPHEIGCCRPRRLQAAFPSRSGLPGLLIHPRHSSPSARSLQHVPLLSFYVPPPAPA